MQSTSYKKYTDIIFYKIYAEVYTIYELSLGRLTTGVESAFKGVVRRKGKKF